MSDAVVQQLIKENQAVLLRERRSAERTTFVRAVIIHPVRRDESYHGFTRDLSPRGIGVVSPVPWEPPAQVSLEIHAMTGRNKVIMAESRWCEEYGKGWYLIGFIFR